MMTASLPDDPPSKIYGKHVQVFQDLPETNVEFNNAMTNISAMTIPAVLEAYGLFQVSAFLMSAVGTACSSAKS